MTSQTHQIRRLGPGDQSAFIGMLNMFAEAFEDPENYTSNQPSPQYREQLLASPTFIALVAEVGNDVIGATAAYVLPKFEQERSEVYLYDLAVSAAHRRRGVATALIRALQKEAADLGAWVTYVQADLGDEPAVELYEKLGTREEVLHFDLNKTQ